MKKHAIAILFMALSLTGLANLAAAKEGTTKDNGISTKKHSLGIGYQYNYYEDGHSDSLYSHGHGFDLFYGNNFFTKGIFTMGVEAGYGFAEFNGKTFLGAMEPVPGISGVTHARKECDHDAKLHQISANLDFAFNVYKKLKVLAQFGISLDILAFESEKELKYYNGPIEVGDGGEATTRSTKAGISLNTNIGLEYEIFKWFAVRAMFESNYASSIKDLDATLGANVAVKFMF